MTPYVIFTVFQIGLLLLVMRLYSQRFIIIIFNNAGARLTVSWKPYFPSDCGFCPLYEIGIATYGRTLFIPVGIHHYDPLPTQSGVEFSPRQHRTLMSAIPPSFLRTAHNVYNPSVGPYSVPSHRVW